MKHVRIAVGDEASWEWDCIVRDDGSVLVPAGWKGSMQKHFLGWALEDVIEAGERATFWTCDVAPREGGGGPDDG